MLRARGLCKSFGARHVLADVDLDVGPGEMVALVGENGAGKSTLIKCIAGILQPDAGSVMIGTERRPSRPAVVWQDLALCDNLDVVANVYLGVELNRLRLDDAAMLRGTRRLLDEMGVDIPDLRVPVSQLSGGQRQMVAIARALLGDSEVLVLDEPAAALGVSETRSLERLLGRLKARGMAILMVSHRIEQIFSLADHIVVLRHGAVVAAVAPAEVHPDDVVALMAGSTVESIARRQLHQLRRLIDELAEVDPASSLSLIVSSLARSMSLAGLALLLLDGEPAQLVLRAEVGLDPAVRARIAVSTAAGRGLLARAVTEGRSVALTEVREDPLLAGAAQSAWAVPIVATRGVVGVIAGFSERAGSPPSDQIELVEVHATLAAVAIEREELVAELRRRNRLHESLRGMLDRLAGPDPVAGGVGIALLPLCTALDAAEVALFEENGGTFLPRLGVSRAGDVLDPGALAHLADAATTVPVSSVANHRARVIAPSMIGVTLDKAGRRMLLAARWADPDAAGGESLDLIEDASRSLALALEREIAEEAQQESNALRTANRLQLDFLHRMSHELRTPLTAIRGYADTLRQADVRWANGDREGFLDRIAAESARMGRLVGDLLDTSAIETGELRLRLDWCDVALVVQAAATCVAGLEAHLVVDVPEAMPAVWADHDRLEQILVNLLDNAVHHGAPPYRVHAAVEPDGATATIVVSDHGGGFTADAARRAFEAHARGATSDGAGLGLTIARGLAAAHGGTLTVSDAPGRTAIVLSLPIEPDDSADEPDPAPRRDEGASTR